MTKGLYLLFAALAYALFLMTFLYLVGFLANFPPLPTTVDRGSAGSAAVVVDIALIILFGVQHSVIARHAFKRQWTKVVPQPIERSLYVVFACVTLIALFFFWRPIEGAFWKVSSPLGTALVWAMFAIGWLIVLTSTFLINHFELFGLQQVYHHARGRTAADPIFRQPFFYRIVRHPLYSGFFLAFWATPSMSYGHLLLAAGMSIYMLVAIRHEERDLLRMFGDEYQTYRVRVGMLTPRVRG